MLPVMNQADDRRWAFSRSGLPPAMPAHLLTSHLLTCSPVRLLAASLPPTLRTPPVEHRYEALPQWSLFFRIIMQLPPHAQVD